MGRETLRARSWENSDKKHPALRGDPGTGGVLSPEAADTWNVWRLAAWVTDSKWECL